jgi:hypothetical protein
VQDAIILYAWKCIINSYLASPVAQAVSLFMAYLDLATTAISSASYFGFQPPPELLPNAPFHFPIHGGWPLTPDWFSKFAIQHFLVSLQVMLWYLLTVGIQATYFVVPFVLQTDADKEPADRCQHTACLGLDGVVLVGMVMPVDAVPVTF